MEFTIEQLVEKMKLDRTAVYGLLQYLTASGQAKVVRTTRVVGSKGKPANVYRIDNNPVIKLASSEEKF
jgi:predicted transcriptional regulator